MYVDRLAHARERAAQVHVDDGVEVVVAHLPQHGVAQHARIRDEDVEPPEAVDRRRDELLRRLGGTHRSDDRDGLAALRLDARDGVCGRLRVDVVHDDGCSLPRELGGIGEPEAAA